MKRFLLTLLIACLTTAVWAQKEQDFASHYMELYAEGTSLSCTTVSPTMMERMLKLPDVEVDKQMRAILAQVKSIRIVSNSKHNESEKLYDKAVELAQHNSKRYKLHTDDGGKALYIRKRGKVVVEMVLLTMKAQSFYMVNLTGNMNDKFLQDILKI